MLLYFAAPLFCHAELAFNMGLTHEIEALGFEGFLPQRDGDQVNQEPIISMSVADRARAIFEMDKAHLFESDIFLFVLDGRVPDEGAAVALGIAHTHKAYAKKDRILVGLHTDKRAAFMGGKLNPMIFSSLDYIATSMAELLVFLKGVKGELE